MLRRFRELLSRSPAEEAYPKSIWGGLVRNYRSEVKSLQVWANEHGHRAPTLAQPGSEEEAWRAASVATVHLYGRLLPVERVSWLDRYESHKNEISLSLSLVFPIFTAFANGLVEERRVQPEAVKEQLEQTLVSAVTGAWPLFSPDEHVQLAQRATTHFGRAVDHPAGVRFLDEVSLAATLWTAAAANAEAQAQAAIEQHLAQQFSSLRELLPERL